MCRSRYVRWLSNYWCYKLHSRCSTIVGNLIHRRGIEWQSDRSWVYKVGVWSSVGRRSFTRYDDLKVL